MKAIVKSIFVIATALAVGNKPFLACAADANFLVVTPALVNQLSEEMRTNHPALRAVQARTSAAEANTRAVRIWEDPTLIVGGMFAEAGMRATIPLQARKGRASYLGERSVGHQDPGATSTALILRALQRAITTEP